MTGTLAEKRISVRRASHCDVCKNDASIADLQLAIANLTESISFSQSTIADYRTKVDMDVAILHEDVSSLRDDVSTMRKDMHALTGSVSDMKNSLIIIAESLKSIADFPETWLKIKGFWSVMRFFRDNAWLLIVVAVVIYFIAVMLSGFKPLPFLSQ